jgi:nucleotide-binding universal stress UspA family protein
MKKILCPIDFSAAAKNGMEYASRLAKALSANLTLLYVRTSIWPEAVQLEEETKKSDETIVAWLSLFASEVHKGFGISCNYEIKQTTATFEEAVAAQANHYDLVVMGTNGADDAYQYIFGSNTFHVIEKSKCPIVVVPEGVSYRPISLLVYAYDPDTNPIFLIEQLKKLAVPLGTKIRVLHIAEKEPSSEANRKMQILQDAVKAREPKNISWSFDFHYSHDVSWALDRYMKENKGDMLALSFHHRSLMERLFKQNVVKQISMTAEYPVFVFWH